MRIGILAQLLRFSGDYRQAGVSRYIEYLLRYLPDALEPDDNLLALAARGAGDRSSVEELPASIQWHYTRWPTTKIPVRILWEQLAAPAITSRLGLDVVHGPVNVVPIAGRVPSVVTIHDLAFLAFPHQYPSAQRRYLRALTMRSVHKATRVLAVSEYTRQDVAERLHVPLERIVTVPNGVSEEFTDRRGTRELAAFKIEQSLPESFLLFVGTLQPRKNLRGLLKAYAAVPQGERPPLYVVGSPGWMYQDIFDDVQQLGIADEVHFPGYATSDSLPLWYSAATAFIYPSYFEGFGLPVLEAMACGTPVVTSNVSSLPEVAGDAGLTASPDDPEQIADAIRRVLQDSELQRQMSERGLARARTYSWRRTAAETAKIYREVAGA